MAPTTALTTESVAAARLRRMAPWLILLAIGAALMVPGIVLEPDARRSARALTTVPGMAGTAEDLAPGRSAAPQDEGISRITGGSPVASK